MNSGKCLSTCSSERTCLGVKEYLSIVSLISEVGTVHFKCSSWKQWELTCDVCMYMNLVSLDSVMIFNESSGDDIYYLVIDLARLPDSTSSGTAL